jgi:hypothetical protein
MEIIGFSMLAAPFVFMIILTWFLVGFEKCFLLFLGISAIAGWVIVAHYFIYGV